MPGIVMEAVSKFYPTSHILANDRASLEVGDLEIHAVVGENGAGKSTLMKVLYGLEQPDSGAIRIGGVEVAIPDPAAAARLGIGMVQQHAEYVPDFTVAENVVLCAEPRRLGFVLSRRKAEAEVAALIEANSFGLDPRARAGSLSEGELQQLEILKLLWRRSSILILDEPTALLADSEVDSLFATLRRLREGGRTILIITHKVGEVRRIADAVTIMRHGRSLARLRVADVPEGELAALMMGDIHLGQATLGPGSAHGTASGAARPAGPGPARAGLALEARKACSGPIFEMRKVSLGRRRTRQPALSELSLEVCAGEILGVCAISGNGLSELEALASGAKRPSSGQVLLSGRPLPRLRRPGVGYVPADRLHRGSSLHSSVAENLAALDRDRLFPRGVADRKAIEAFASEAIEGYGIAAVPEQRLGTLSGGTIQKVVLARELAGSSSFLLFSNPTWGLDLSSAAFVRERIHEAKAAGAAILLVSATLDEVLELADRIGILSRGRLVLEVDNDGKVDRGRLGRAMLGLDTTGGRP